jgi:hypothetical protein
MEIVVQGAPTLGTICHDAGYVANAAIITEVHADGVEFNAAGGGSLLGHARWFVGASAMALRPAIAPGSLR